MATNGEESAGKLEALIRMRSVDGERWNIIYLRKDAEIPETLSCVFQLDDQGPGNARAKRKLVLK